MPIAAENQITDPARRLDPDRMLANAIELTGLDHFGSSQFLDDYRETITALHEEASLSSTGMTAIEDFVQRNLVNRLRLHRDLAAHPEIEAQELAPPIVITGFPRTGSTKLQRMLSASPGVQSLTFWKMLNLAPFETPQGSDADPRIAAAQQLEELAKRAFPEVWATHPTPALDAEEDFLLHEMTFAAPTIPMRMGAPKLLRRQTPIARRVYSEMRTMLKYLQWQHERSGGVSRPFILKSPIHIGSLTTLAEVFPGCRVIHCHRAIDVSIVSTASMMDHSQQIYLDHVDPHTVGREVLEYWSREWDRNLKQRASVPVGTCLDVSFADINANAMNVLEEIHAFCDLPLTPASRAAMLQWESENARHKHGKRSYRIEDYGLTVERIRGACSAYLDAFEHLGLQGTRQTAQ